MKMPNWFDQQYAESLQNATAEESLAKLAKDPRILSDLKTALAEFDGRKPMPGPSRTQVIRDTIAATLQAAK